MDWFTEATKASVVTPPAEQESAPLAASTGATPLLPFATRTLWRTLQPASAEGTPESPSCPPSAWLLSSTFT